jgi:hypothetical protein
VWGLLSRQDGGAERRRELRFHHWTAVRPSVCGLLAVIAVKPCSWRRSPCKLFLERRLSPICIDDQMAGGQRIIVANRPVGRVKMKVGGSLSSYTFARRQLIMTRLSSATLAFVAATVIAVGGAASAQAQCAGCGTQTVFSPVIAQPQATVAFSPVVAAPTFVASPMIVQQPRQHWYPGRMLDNMRMNRWGLSNTAWVQPQTVAFAPAPVVQTVGFAPMASVQTVNFAPSAPYVTGYAPMQRTFVGYAPTATTVFSPAVIEPVVSSGCSTCSTCVTAAAPCSACAGATTVVEQASFNSPVTTVAPSSGCSSCAEGASSVPTYYTPPAAAPASIPQSAPLNTGPSTPQPELATEPAPPAGTGAYGANRQETPAEAAASATEGPEAPAEKSTLAPKPLSDSAEEPATPAAGDPSTFQAPPLLGPQNNRTANRPTVDIHDAVYRQPARKATVGTTTVAKPLTPASTAPQTDANGWYSVSER